MINLSSGPNQKNAWDLLCRFISGYIAEIMEERYGSFFMRKDMGEVRRNKSFAKALILDHLFPSTDYPQEDAVDVFLTLYSLLRTDKIYRSECPVMQMVIFRLLSYRVTSSADERLYSRIDLPVGVKQALIIAYSNDYDNKVKDIDDPRVISKEDYVNHHIAYYEDLGNYIELLFAEPEFLLINNVTKEDILQNPQFYRGFTVSKDPNVIDLSLIDTGCIRRMVCVKTDTFPFVFLD